MNKIYKVIFCKRTGKRVAVSECTKSSGKRSGGKATVCVAAACTVGIALFGASTALAQMPSIDPCGVSFGGLISGGQSCADFINSTDSYVNSLSTGLSTTNSNVGSLSTGLSSVSAGLSSLSTGVSSLSTSTSTGLSTATSRFY